MRLIRFINRVRLVLQPHYLVFGHYYNAEPMGCCRGKSGKRDVLAEEPLATFKRCPKRKCPICKEYDL